MAMQYKEVKYPFIPEGKRFYYIPEDNEYMQAAKKFARHHSSDKTMPLGAVLVKSGNIIGAGANSSDYHKKYGCERRKLGIPTGERYDLCPGCDPKNHAEKSAIADAIAKGHDTRDADMYLWGHWWVCQQCWRETEEAGIRDIYLVKDSDTLFNSKAPSNAIGHQFDNYSK